MEDRRFYWTVQRRAWSQLLLRPEVSLRTSVGALLGQFGSFYSQGQSKHHRILLELPFEGGERVRKAVLQPLYLKPLATALSVSGYEASAEIEKMQVAIRQQLRTVRVLVHDIQPDAKTTCGAEVPALGRSTHPLHMPDVLVRQLLVRANVECRPLQALAAPVHDLLIWMLLIAEDEGEGRCTMVICILEKLSDHIAL